MDAPQHMGLTLRKALAPKLCFYESQIAFETFVRHSGLGVQFETLRNGVASESNLNLVRTRTNDAEPLDNFVRNFVELELQASDLRLREENERVGLQPLVSLFKDSAQTIVCKACAEGRICRGSSYDHAIVDKGGRCIRQLRVLFDIAVKIANSYYSAYVPNAAIPELRFSTQAVLSSTEPLHGVESRQNIVVSGRASRTGERRTDVILRLDVDRFNYESYLTILYVMLHECLIHAYEGTLAPAPEWDSFAEGWMDYVVERALDEALDSAGPARAVVGDRVRTSLPIKDATHDFARARADYNGRAQKTTTAALGRDAAQRLIRTLQTLEPELPSPVIDSFFTLSLNVNAAEIPPLVRNCFVMTFASPIGTVSAGLAAPEVVRSLLRYFRRQQSVVDMVAEIGALSTP